MNNNTALAENPTFPPLPSVQLQELIVSLEQATLMAKQLPATTNHNHLLRIYSSLHQAHHHLSSYISHTHQFPPPLLPPPQLSPHAVAESSFSSATAAADENGNEPMQVGDDDYEAGAEENSSKVSVDKVEERMRDCFIKNKRPKRPLSPSSAAVAEERRLCVDDGHVGEMYVFDPHETRLRALDLIYQFHG